MCIRDRFDAARDDEIGVAGADRLRSVRNGGHAGGAEAVDCVPRKRIGQASKQHGHSGDVSVVFAGLVCGTEDHLVDGLGGHPGALDQSLQHMSREIVRSHRREGSSVAPDRGAHSIYCLLYTSRCV